jgi:2-polyprenyl-3-methyl-5-hydroxy-6-metoxy-1,4-benzoquinol methylase
MNATDNTLKNEKHYDKIYENINVAHIVAKLNNLTNFLNDATITDTSWVGFYYHNFKDEIKNKKILEIGCGDCTNAAVMAALGAEVYANDISQKSGAIISELNTSYKFDKPIKFIDGNFLDANLEGDYFDYVVGKAFIHHLTHEQEITFTKKIILVLKPDGKVRFSEPAVNSKILDKLRWIIPVPNRPSILQTTKFKQWKENDPHPERDNSCYHFKSFGKLYFNTVKIIPLGCIERFHRLLPQGAFNRKFRRFAFKIEKYLPFYIRQTFARSQVVIYANPKK